MIKKLTAILSMAFAMLACTPASDNSISVVPYPNEVDIRSGSFDAAGAEFHYAPGMDGAVIDIIEGLAGQLSLVSGQRSTIDEKGSRDGFIFALNEALGEEAYRLEVSRKAVCVEASSLRSSPDSS